MSVVISDPEWPNWASTRAAIIRKGRSGIVVRRDTVPSVVTPDDCLSESDAEPPLWADGSCHHRPCGPYGAGGSPARRRRSRGHASPSKGRSGGRRRGSKLVVNKITWAQVGRVTDPGRYMFKFGWLTITADDLAIWQAYPNAAFTLLRTLAPTTEAEAEAIDEYRLGTFELRENLSLSEK